MRAGQLHPAGYTLLEVLVSLGIGSILVSAIITVLANTAQIQTNAWAITEMMQIRNGFHLALQSNTAWRNTIGANISRMGCLANNSPCTVDGTPGGTPISGQSFALYDANKALLFDATNPASGLTPSGSPCKSFSPENGNDSCPFRFELNWSANCKPGNCVNPLVNISARLRYSPATAKLALDLDRYSLLNFYSPTTNIAPPICQLLTQRPNNNNFTVSWTAGSGNGGVGGCRIQYQMDNGTWANVASPVSVNCDASGGTAGTITVPGDGWLGGAWGSPVAVQLVRNSNNQVMCTLGNLTCSALAGSTTPTPTIDEDCNNQWDNNTGGLTNTCEIDMPEIAPGAPYRCPSLHFNRANQSITRYDCSIGGGPAATFEGVDFSLGGVPGRLFRTPTCVDRGFDNSNLGGNPGEITRDSGTILVQSGTAPMKDGAGVPLDGTTQCSTYTTGVAFMGLSEAVFQGSANWSGWACFYYDATGATTDTKWF